MISPLSFENITTTEFAKDGLLIKDISNAEKFGIKGKGAEEFLKSQDIKLPEKYNSAVVDNEKIVMRLGVSEYLLEGVGVSKFYDLPKPDKAYQVLRQDCCLLLRGAAIYKILSQSCAIDFVKANAKELPLFLTSMVGVGVTILLSEEEGLPEVRIYCDPTYGSYLFKTLLEIGGDL